MIGGGVSGNAVAELADILHIPCRVISDSAAAGLSFEKIFADVELVVTSPGVLPESALLQYARKNLLPIISELEFGIRHFPGRLVAVTGTNGKTTTVELTEFLLKKLGRKVVAAGNIGLPLSAVAAELMRKKDPAAVEMIAVLEVSSFQLEYTDYLPAEAAVLLNVESDHINRYPGGMAEYRAVKERIFRNVPPEKCFYGASMSNASSAGDFAIADLQLFYKSCKVADLHGSCFAAPHNQENLLAALCLVGSIVDLEDKTAVLGSAILEFQTGDHRISLVAEFNGVKYIDDSKATNPAAVKAAVTALEQVPHRNIVLIAGGLDKDMDFMPLGGLAPYLRKVVVYGRCGGLVAQAFENRVECFDAGNDFALAVNHAAANAVAGDVVLLSPAAASMDMFKDYKARGDEFARLVREFIAGIK